MYTPMIITMFMTLHTNTSTQLMILLEITFIILMILQVIIMLMSLNAIIITILMSHYMITIIHTRIFTTRGVNRTPGAE